MLDGALRVRGGTRYVETSIGGLRAAVIRREAPLSKTVTYDLAIASQSTRELDPMFQHTGVDEWRLDDSRVTVPPLRHDYVFAGCRGGVLFATTYSTPSVEDVVVTLWDLAAWARLSWRPVDPSDHPRWHADERRRRRHRMLARVGTVVGTVLVVALFRRLR